MANQEGKCNFEGNDDMYGMGIRIGYYLQWYGAILAAWIAPDESQGLRIANSLFVTATFLALVILTVRNHKPEDLPIVETYIILFLAFGSYLVLVPVYIWRIFTGCNPLWDPTRFPRANPGRVYSVCNTLLLVTVLVFQLWFWVHQVPKLDGEECTQYGFFFWKFDLNSKSFMALNIIPSIILLGICMTTVGTIGWKILVRGRNWRDSRKKYLPLDSVPRRRIYVLQVLDSASQTIVTTVIIIGVELTIIWNEIEGVHDISSAGQTIPLFLGIGAVAMVFYVRFFKKDAEEVLTDDAATKPSLPQSSSAQRWEMGSAQAYFNQGTTQTNTPPVHATAWNDLPGAARAAAEGGKAWWGGAHGHQA